MVVTVKDLSLELVMMMMMESFGIKIEIMSYDQFSIKHSLRICDMLGRCTGILEKEALI